MRKSIITLCTTCILATSYSFADDISVNNGWNLRGTSTNFATMNDFNKSCIQYVWLYDDNHAWKCFSPNPNISQNIINAGYGALHSIDKKYGFWILADGNCQITSSSVSTDITTSNNLIDNTLKANWQKQIGSAALEDIRAMAVDNNGNVFISGIYNGNIDGITTPQGSGDIFIAKYNANGTQEWIKTLNSINFETPMQMAYSSVDDTIVITGYSTGSLDLNPGISTFMNKSAGSFVIKLNSYNGSFRNAVSWENSGAKFLDIDIDSNGNLYLTGTLGNRYSQYKTYDVNPSSSNFNITTHGYMDGLIIKLNRSFDFEWVKSNGSQNKTTVFTNSTLDNSNHIHTTGFTADSSVTSSTRAYTDRTSFIQIYNTSDSSSAVSYNLQYFNKAVPLSIGVTSSGDSVVCGVTTIDTGYLNSNILKSTIDVLDNGQSSLFVAKFDNYGHEKWRIQANSFGQSACYGLDIDSNDNIIIAGEYDGSIKIGNYSLDSVGGSMDSFIAGIDSNGTVTGIKSFGGYQEERIQRIELHNNFIYATGWFDGILTFNSDLNSLSSKGSKDGFIVKLAK